MEVFTAAIPVFSIGSENPELGAGHGLADKHDG